MTDSQTPALHGDGFTLLKKGLLLATLPFLFQLLFIGLVVWMRWQSREAEWWFVHTKEVIAQAEAAYATLVEAHNAARGFVASGDDLFLSDFKKAALEAPEELQDLHDQVSDNSHQQTQVEQIKSQAVKFLAWLERNELTARDRRVAASAGWDDRQMSRKGREQLADIRQKMNLFLKDEERLEAIRREARDRAWRRLDGVVVAGSVATILSIVVLAWVFGRSIRGRFAVLADNARRLAEEQELAPPLSGGDEITRIDRVFHRMARSLREAGLKEREHTRTLEQQTAELGVANRELQEFASVASHDLQEPLRKIQAFGDRLRTTCSQNLGDRGLDYLERMQNAAGRMQRLINDLLAFSRVTTKAKPFEPVDMNRIAAEVVSDLEGRMHQTGGRVEVGELPTIDADPLQMRQLLQNLIGNALKFHRPGVPPEVRVEAKRVSESESGIELSVQDNGIGFDEKYLDRIFNVFQRLHGRNEYEGAGMGLAICRKIVERHQGSITVRSVPGQGSTFLVVLPAFHVSSGNLGSAPLQGVSNE